MSSLNACCATLFKSFSMRIKTQQIFSRGKHSIRAHPPSVILSASKQFNSKHPYGSYLPLLSVRRLSSETESSSSNNIRDSRLTGRRRFYKHVGVHSVGAPWEDVVSCDVTNSHVESPISAGVDGTQSASGVKGSLSKEMRESIRKKLVPRKAFLDPAEISTRAVTTQEIPIAWYGVTLDGRTIRTPLGMTLAVPSETLAWAIAAEWDAQEDYLQPAQMPLMTLACTALDQTASAPDVVQEQALKFLGTDTICYWADPTEDRVLNKRQQQAWEHIHNYCEKLLCDKVAVAVGANEGLLMSRVRRNKSIGLPHPEQVIVQARKIVQSLDIWHLTALSSICSGSKSLLVALASLADDVDPKSVIKAARVEEEFQISNWGMVEGGHDYDRLNCSIQMLSAHIFMSSIRNDNNL